MKNFEEVLQEYMNMVKSMARKYKARFKRLEFEELEQVATISLWNAYETYTDKNAKFSTYAYLVMDRGLMRFVKDTLSLNNKAALNKDAIEFDGYTYLKKTNKKETSEEETIEMLKEFGMPLKIKNVEVYGGNGIGNYSKDKIVENVLMDEMVVDERELNFLKMRYQGYSIREIADIYDTSKSTVDRVLKMIGERNLQFDPEFQLSGFFS